MAKRAPKKKAPRKKRVKAVPDDFPAVSANLTVADVKKAMDFYTKAFGFKLKGEPMHAGRVIVHAVLSHRGSTIMLGPPSMDGSGALKSPAMAKLKTQAFGLYVYVSNVNAHHKQVKRFKGIKVTEPVDTFWGDRMYEVVDRDGHHWTFASHKAEPTMEEMKAAMKAMMGG